MDKTTRNERSADLVAKLIAVFLIFVIGYSAGYYQAASDAAAIVLGSR